MIYSFQLDWFKQDMMKATLAMLEMDRKERDAKEGKRK